MIGPCGAVSYVLSKTGWGRIAECWYGLGDKAQFEKLDEDGRYDHGWQQHYVVVNKFVGLIDVTGAYLCHPTLASKPHYLELRITDTIDPGDQFLWPKKALEFWRNKLLASPVAFNADNHYRNLSKETTEAEHLANELRNLSAELRHVAELTRKDESTEEEVRAYINTLPEENHRLVLNRFFDDLTEDAKALEQSSEASDAAPSKVQSRALLKETGAP